jgi:DNA-directed RNA polymerase subunit RPC12/RpoP
MRYFKCFDCEHFWKIIFWENGKGTKIACPECKSLNVRRIEKLRAWDREGKYATLVNDEDHTPTSPESKPDRGVLLKIESLPPRKPATKNLTSKIRIVLIQGKLNGFIERFGKHSP